MNKISNRVEFHIFELLITKFCICLGEMLEKREDEDDVVQLMEEIVISSGNMIRSYLYSSDKKLNSLGISASGIVDVIIDNIVLEFNTENSETLLKTFKPFLILLLQEIRQLALEWSLLLQGIK